MPDVASPNIITKPSEVGPYLTKFASMKTERLDFDSKNQLVSDYILPRRDFSIPLRPNQLRPHRVTSGLARRRNARFAAFLTSFLIDRSRPNLLPNVKRGLAMAGRDTALDDDGLRYLTSLSWTIFDHMMLPRAQLMSRLGSIMEEYAAFGNGVMWTGRERGFGPYFNARPFQSCWWSENEKGRIDTLYFRMLLPIYRICQRWPDALNIDGWDDAAKKEDEQALSPVLICVEPRGGGLYGAHVLAKPFKYVVVAEDKKRIIEQSGFDSFPYQVFRRNPLPGQAYAEGIGGQVLPDVMVLNHLTQAVENIAEQKAVPPLAWPARMFGKPLDRRPGAPNSYNPQGIGLQRADQAILKLDFTGSIDEALGWIKELKADIDEAYYKDLMDLRESGDMTAEEVIKRGDLSDRGFMAEVNNCELPLTVAGDRLLEGLAAEGLLPKPVPASVAGADVDWEYAGPLMLGQLKGVVQGSLQLLNARGLANAQDPAAAQRVNVEEILTTIHAGLGLPPSQINPQSTVDDARQQAAEQQQQQHNADQLSKVAGAAGDAAGGISDIAGAAQPGPPGPGAAQFAPAAPLASPLAA